MTNELPELPPVTPGPLYQAVMIDGDCADEFFEYVQAYARAAVEQGGGGEVRLWDSQWVQVVNHADCYAGWTVEDAVHRAVKMTEHLIAENVAAGKLPPATPPTASAEQAGGGEAVEISLCAKHGAYWVRDCETCDNDLEMLAAMDMPPTASAGVTEAMVEAACKRYDNGQYGRTADRAAMRFAIASALSAAKGEV